MEKIILYTKLNCHLCEKVYQMLMELTLDIPLEIDMIDISHTHNQHLLDDYAERIPVLAKPNAETELEWPFSLEDIRAYLAG
jgi:glutathione S-transferase